MKTNGFGQNVQKDNPLRIESIVAGKPDTLLFSFYNDPLARLRTETKTVPGFATTAVVVASRPLSDNSVSRLCGGLITTSFNADDRDSGARGSAPRSVCHTDVDSGSRCSGAVSRCS